MKRFEIPTSGSDHGSHRRYLLCEVIDDAAADRLIHALTTDRGVR